MLSKLRGNALIVWPAHSDTVVNSIIGNFKFFRPFNYGIGYPVNRKNSVCISISSLLTPRSPLAITRIIAFFIVNSFNGIINRWPFTHIFEKTNKRVSPSTANYNSSATITIIRVCSRIRTPRNHLLPRTIFWSWVCRATMFCYIFFMKTTTRFCMSVWQPICSYFQSFSTRTLTDKISMPINCSIKFFNSKITKFLTDRNFGRGWHRYSLRSEILNVKLNYIGDTCVL